MVNEELMSSVRNLLRLQDKSTAAAIDAGCCGTSHDFKRAREAEHKLQDAIEEFEAKFASEVEVG